MEIGKTGSSNKGTDVTKCDLQGTTEGCDKDRVKQPVAWLLYQNVEIGKKKGIVKEKNLLCTLFACFIIILLI